MQMLLFVLVAHPLLLTQAYLRHEKWECDCDADVTFRFSRTPTDTDRGASQAREVGVRL